MEQERVSNCFVSIGTCLILSVAYVGSLYMWRTGQDSNHPATIKKRFISGFIMMFISPFFLYFAINKNTLQKHSLRELMGFRTKGIVPAVFMPLFLTMILFLGPLATKGFTGLLKLYLEPHHWKNNLQNVLWLRAHLVAPLSEEFTFRSCMLPLLLQCFSPMKAVFICPLFFGVAHFHHMIERLRVGYEFKVALFVSCFQLTYTTIFGAYSAYLFLRTGHFISTFVAHSFCNHMGVPDITELTQIKGQQRTIIILLYFLGLLLWCLFLNPLTEPSWYCNDLEWKV